MSLHLTGVPHGTYLGVAMPRDGFGLFLIESHQLRAGLGVGAKELVELGMDGEGVAAAGALNEERHDPDRQGRNRIKIKSAPLEPDPEQA
jgi:hypothetical protein